MLVVLACLTGVLLGLTFNVLVLIPATLAGILAYGLFAQEHGLGLSAMILPAISLQAGYMIGLTGRDTLSHLRARLSVAQSKRV